MANYMIPAQPVYDGAVRRLENTDPASAEGTFNPLVGQLVENTHAVRTGHAAYRGVTAGTSVAYTLQVDADFALFDGQQVLVKPHTANGTHATLSINGGDALPLLDAEGEPMGAGDIHAGVWIKLAYSEGERNGFFVLGGNGIRYPSVRMSGIAETELKRKQPVHT